MRYDYLEDLPEETNEVSKVFMWGVIISVFFGTVACLLA